MPAARSQVGQLKRLCWRRAKQTRHKVAAGVVESKAFGVCVCVCVESRALMRSSRSKLISKSNFQLAASGLKWNWSFETLGRLNLVRAEAREIGRPLARRSVNVTRQFDWAATKRRRRRRPGGSSSPKLAERRRAGQTSRRRRLQLLAGRSSGQRQPLPGGRSYGARMT